MIQTPKGLCLTFRSMLLVELAEVEILVQLYNLQIPVL